MNFYILIILFLQVEEFVALVDPRLSLFTGDEEQFDSYDDKPQHKLTNFRLEIFL